MLRDKVSGEVKTFVTDQNGEFSDDLAGVPCPGALLNYEVTLAKDGYQPKQVTYTKAIVKPGKVHLGENLDIDLFKIGSDIVGLCQIEDLLYDFNKSNIRKDAALELDKLVACMKANPSLVVEIGSHTDCRASEAYNRALASRRAKSARRYVISKGISGKRIFGKGYGESKLINNCACEPTNDSDCTEDEHQLNRRTEFRIVKGGSKIYNTSTNSFGN